MPPRRSGSPSPGWEPSRLRRSHEQASGIVAELLEEGRAASQQPETQAEPSADEVGTVLERLFTGPEAVEFRNRILHVPDSSPFAWHQARLSYLESLANRLRHYETVADLGAPATATPDARPSGRTVFVVHGHDEAAKLAVARTLEQLGLEPIILHEQPDEGRTILEKFENHAQVGFAIVLLTPDDACGEHKRARQNVILEFGYFLGRLGRQRVRALYKEGLQLPSDVSGWAYIPMDDVGAWKLLLARELRASGLDVDLNRLA